MKSSLAYTYNQNYEYQWAYKITYAQCGGDSGWASRANGTLDTIIRESISERGTECASVHSAMENEFTHKGSSEGERFLADGVAAGTAAAV